MPSRKNRSQLYAFVLVPIVLILLGAFALSAASVFENMRFAKATTQILSFVRMIRSFAGEQKTFSLNSGEDAWAVMVRLGQISATTKPVNPWGGDIRATAAQGGAVRVETDLPSQDCRRIALYFLGLHPSELGLLSVEAQSDQDATWSVVYPSPAAEQVVRTESSCGTTTHSRLALVFKIL